MHNNHTKFLLVLGGSTDQMFMLETARKMGLQTACLDANPGAPGLRAADLSAAIDFSNLAEVFGWIDEQRTAGVNLAGVSTMGSDVPHLLAAISQHYRWSGPSPETGRLTTDKLAMKERLSECGVPVPRFCQVISYSQARKRWESWHCREVVIKPTDRAGSRGVQVIANPDQLGPAVDQARAQGKSGCVIMEEFITGPQISTETLTYQGRALTPGFADRLYEGMEGFRPQILENGGWLPSCFADTPLAQQVCSLVERAAAALGLATGVAKGDVVICPKRGPMVIEMAGRLSGGDFSAGLVPLGTGVNYVTAVIEMALGQEPDWLALTPQHQLTVANRYFFPPAGLLTELELPADLVFRPQVVKLEITCQPGDELPIIRSHGDRAGVMVITGESRREVQTLIDEIYTRVRFKIAGHWHEGRP